MKKTTTQKGAWKLPRIAMAILRADGRAFARVAERCGISPGHVTKVAKGERCSARVTYALIREAIALARVQSAQAAVDLERARAEVSEPAGVSCGPRELGAR